MTTNEFERDFNDQGGLKRPGRIDFRTLQNTADAGDGSPGVQRCFRNYLHEGGMEKDIDLTAHGIKGTSVDISNVELQQLSNIGSVEINGTQWGYVGGADQPVKQADSPTFNGLTVSGLTVNGNIVIIGNVDGVNVSNFKISYDAHLHNTQTLQFDGVNSDGGAFNFTTTGIVTFNQDVTVPNLVTDGNVDGVDVSEIKLNSMPSAADGDISVNNQAIINVGNVDGVDVSDHAHSGAGQGGTVDHTSLTNVLTSQHHIKYTDASALAASYMGEPSTTVQQSNDAEKNGIGSIETWYKIKEITVYQTIKCDIYWEFRSENFQTIKALLKKNGVLIGSNYSTSQSSYQPITVSDVYLVRGDTIELWGEWFQTDDNAWYRYFRIKYDKYNNTLV